MTEALAEQGKIDNQSPSEQEQFWHNHYRRWRQSGLSLAGYARSQGLVENTFYGWHARLKQRGLAKPEPATPVFHRVTIKQTEPATDIGNEILSLRFRLPNGICCETEMKLKNVASFLDKLSQLPV